MVATSSGSDQTTLLKKGQLVAVKHSTPVQAVCQTCGIDYLARNRKQKYCSRSCYYVSTGQPKEDQHPVKILRKCERCLEEFTTTGGNINWCRRRQKSDPRYCSNECYWQARRDRKQPEEYQCRRCLRTLPFTSDHFPTHNKHKYGLDTRCRSCTNDAAKLGQKRYKQKLRRDLFTHYGNGLIACACCGEKHEEFLTIDHVNGGGSEERRKQTQNGILSRLRREGYPPGYRILCMNCNFSIGIRGYCPHHRRPDRPES